LMYFPIFLYFVDFFKIYATSPLAAAAAAAQLAAAADWVAVFTLKLD
jgi:hypothetical protein